jgi:hypothetical protein
VATMSEIKSRLSSYVYTSFERVTDRSLLHQCDYLLAALLGSELREHLPFTNHQAHSSTGNREDFDTTPDR